MYPDEVVALESLIQPWAEQERLKKTLIRATREDTLGEFACHDVLFITEITRSLLHEMLDLCPLRICQRNLGAELRVVDLTDACIVFEVHAIQSGDLVSSTT